MSQCVDPAALVAAAVRAAILAKAPRRTVAAVAAATAGAFLHRQAPKPQQSAKTPTRADDASSLPAESSPEALMQAIREDRQAKRERKRARRKANRRLRASASVNCFDEDAKHDGSVNLASLRDDGRDKEVDHASPRTVGGGGVSERADVVNKSPELKRPRKTPGTGSDMDSVISSGGLPAVPLFPPGRSVALSDASIVSRGSKPSTVFTEDLEDRAVSIVENPVGNMVARNAGKRRDRGKNRG